MPSLSTNYLGMALKNPLVCSPSPLSKDLSNLRAMEDAGASLVVMHSLFEEQIDLESELLHWHVMQGDESYAEALNYFPQASAYHLGPDEYLEQLRQAKEALGIPVMGSLNGVSTGGWLRYAKLMEEAGADGLELNIYYLATDHLLGSADVEKRYVETVRAVREHVKIPVAVKVGPYFSAPAHMCMKLSSAGAAGLVLFNRFYQPDLDIEKLEVTPNLVLSQPSELRLRLLWTAVLYGKVEADIAITGGVHSGEDVLKCMMAGANVAMMTSAILRHGVAHLALVLRTVERWMESHEYVSIEEMRGSMSQQSVKDPEAFERANYIRLLNSYRDVIPGRL